MEQTNFDDLIDRDDDPECVEATERSEDLDLFAENFYDLLIAPTDWTIETLYNQIGNQIDLDPAFQRRNVWNYNAKSSFIESLFLGIPIPQILLSSKEGQRNSFLVLDGKQRLLTIKEFLDGHYDNGKEFKLQNLRVQKSLEGKTWSEISKNPEWAQQLLNETQRTAVIRNWSAESILYEIFFRLNSGSVKLSPMELRMSLHPGAFLKYIIRWTETIGPLHFLIGKKCPDPRMNDVELAVRFLAFSEPELQYRGNLKSFLDEACKQFNYAFEQSENAEQQFTIKLKNLDDAITAGLDILGRGSFCKKHVGGKFETRFNRAVFDVQIGALSHPKLRELALGRQEDFKNVFIKCCEDQAFRRAIESTTKSNEATRTRFHIFYAEIDKVFDVKLEEPNIS